MHARKSCRKAVAGLDVQPAFRADAFPQPQFASPQDLEPGGTIAKRPVAGPTSRLLRVFLHQRLEGRRPRMTVECRDVQAEASGGGLGPVLNESELKELCADLPMAEAREFIWLCIVDTELRLTDIASHRAAGDLECVAKIARGIAREAAKLGAVRVHVLALRLETACRAGAGTYSLITELSGACTEAGDAMCAWLTRQVPA